MSSKSCAAAFTMFCVAALMSTAMAGPVVYGNWLGENLGEVDFLEVGEESASGVLPLFGVPVSRSGNSLYFLPLTFASSSADGSTDTTDSTLTMRILADEGMYLGRIGISEVGDYLLTGLGADATFANVEGTLIIEDLSPGSHGTFQAPLIVDPAAPYALPDDSYSAYTGSAEIDLSTYGITEVLLTFENILTTASEDGTTAFIQKKSIEGTAVSIETIIPEPTSMALLALGALGLIARRRK